MQLLSKGHKLHGKELPNRLVLLRERKNPFANTSGTSLSHPPVETWAGGKQDSSISQRHEVEECVSLLCRSPPIIYEGFRRARDQYPGLSTTGHTLGRTAQRVNGGSMGTIWRVSDAIREAWRDNRMIVPLVGAGISAESGIPIVRSIVRYFGKFQQLIEHGAFLPHDELLASLEPRSSDGTPRDLLGELCRQYRDKPWRFVEAFGWPDRFQLNQDLYDFIRENRGRPEVPSTVGNAAERGVTAALSLVNPGGEWHLRALEQDLLVELLSTIMSGATSTEVRKAAKEAYLDYQRSVEEPERTKHSREDARAAWVGRISLNTNFEPIRQVLGSLIGRFESHQGGSVPFNIAGDWKRLIQHYTGFQGDYADALIARLCAGHGPGVGHQFLAYLSRLVGSRLVLTYNFDDLIERALQDQGVPPRVFGMEEGTRLPPEMLVRDAVAVFKLHGNNHALLLDERVDHPLSEIYKKRFAELVGDDPLLLVVGCSGDDARVRDLVQHVLAKRPEKSGPSITWLHFEPDPPTFLERLAKRYEGAVVTARTNHPGADLMHVFTALSGRHPAAGERHYPVHLPTPTLIPSTNFAKAKPFDDDDEWEKLKASNGVIISTLEGKGPRQHGSYSASEALLHAADRWSHSGYNTIWVDLEAVNTIAGVVGVILDQCRGYDSHLPASVLPEEDGDSVVKAAVRLTAYALQRNRYFIALDGLETFPWGPLTHHGDTNILAGKALGSLGHLMHFFYDLTRAPLGSV